MSDAIREQLSAFVDGELSAAEAELFLKRVERDAALRASLDRYLLMSEAVRSQSAGGPSRDFASRVATAIELETAVPHKTGWRMPRSRWAMPAAGGAVAASVLAAAVFFAPRLTGTDGGAFASREGAQQEYTEQTIIPADAVRAAQARLAAEYPSDMPVLQVSDGGRLAGYVMAHSEYSSPLGRRNVLTGLLSEEQAGEGPMLETEATTPAAQTQVQINVPPQR
jgi:sigma-E factor negative regulatory protein RseA